MQSPLVPCQPTDDSTTPEWVASPRLSEATRVVPRSWLTGAVSWRFWGAPGRVGRVASMRKAIASASQCVKATRQTGDSGSQAESFGDASPGKREARRVLVVRLSVSVAGARAPPCTPRRWRRQRSKGRRPRPTANRNGRTESAIVVKTFDEKRPWRYRKARRSLPTAQLGLGIPRERQFLKLSAR